ncbi:MAG: putative immunity protein [Bacillota bacterium]
MILPKIRDERFITVRRGGTLSDEDHRLLAIWAAQCARHVLHYFEEARPDDDRPRRAIESTQAWVNGEITMKQTRFAAGASQDAAREVKEASEAARLAALSAGQAAAVAHVAAHELGAAAYAIRSVMAASPENKKEMFRRRECRWQRDRLPERIYNLVIDDERLRNDICWFVFSEDL